MSLHSPLQSRISSGKSPMSCLNKHPGSGSILGDTSFKNRIMAYSPLPSPPSKSSSRKTSAQKIQTGPSLSLNGWKIPNSHFRQQSANISPKNKHLQFPETKSNHSDESPVIKPTFGLQNSYLSVRKIEFNQKEQRCKDIETESLLSCSSHRRKNEKDDLRVVAKMVNNWDSQNKMWEELEEAGVRLKARDGTFGDYSKYSQILNNVLFRGSRRRRRLLQDFPEGVVLGLLNNSLFETVEKIRRRNESWRRMRCDLTRRDPTFSGFVPNGEFLELLQGKNMRLTNNEEYSLLAYFDPDFSGFVSYNHFLRMIM